MDGVSDQRTRLIQERDELSGRLGRLNAFIFRDPEFGTLPAEERTLLRQQYMAMEQYRTILDFRLRDFTL